MGDITFIRTVLWKKLPVGQRLENWLPQATTCPVCGQLEMSIHAQTTCKSPPPPPAFHIARQCIGPAIFDDTQEADPVVLLWDLPVLSLQSPLGLVYWTVVRASWRLRNLVKFKSTPPTWDIFLACWLRVLQQWAQHPEATMPAQEVRLLHAAVSQLKETGQLIHPRVQGLGSRSPPQLRKPKRKKRKKELQAQQLVQAHNEQVEQYRQAGWDIVYTDGSSELHPEAGRVGGYGVYYGDSRDVAEPLPPSERQTNNRGELRAALHAALHRNRHKHTFCSDSLLLVQGATGKAQKWRRHDWQGSGGPVSHVDLWSQILAAIEEAGAQVQWLHVPSHIGVIGNENADVLADMGRRKSPLLRGHITVSRA